MNDLPLTRNTVSKSKLIEPSPSSVTAGWLLDQEEERLWKEDLLRKTTRSASVTFTGHACLSRGRMCNTNNQKGHFSSIMGNKTVRISNLQSEPCCLKLRVRHLSNSRDTLAFQKGGCATTHPMQGGPSHLSSAPSLSLSLSPKTPRSSNMSDMKAWHEIH